MPGTFVRCVHSSNINKRSHGSGGVSACCHDSSRANCRCYEDSTLIYRRDLQQQQYMRRIQITNKGPPITAAFVASDKSYHHLNIPTTKNTNTALLDDMFKQIKPTLKQHLLHIGLAVHFYPHPRTGHWKHKE